MQVCPLSLEQLEVISEQFQGLLQAWADLAKKLALLCAVPFGLVPKLRKVSEPAATVNLDGQFWNRRIQPLEAFVK